MLVSRPGRVYLRLMAIGFSWASANVTGAVTRAKAQVRLRAGVLTIGDDRYAVEAVERVGKTFRVSTDRGLMEVTRAGCGCRG